MQCLKILASFDSAFANAIQQSKIKTKHGELQHAACYFLLSNQSARLQTMAGVYLHPGTHAPTTPPSHSKPFHAIRGHSVPFLSSSALANQKPNPFAARQPGILAVSWCQDCCNEKKKQGGGGSSSELVAVAFGIVPATAAWLYFYAHAILYIFAIYFAGHKFICGCNSNSPLPGRRTQDDGTPVIVAAATLVNAPVTVGDGIRLKVKYRISICHSV